MCADIIYPNKYTLNKLFVSVPALAAHRGYRLKSHRFDPSSTACADLSAVMSPVVPVGNTQKHCSPSAIILVVMYNLGNKVLSSYIFLFINKSVKGPRINCYSS